MRGRDENEGQQDRMQEQMQQALDAQKKEKEATPQVKIVYMPAPEGEAGSKNGKVAQEELDQLKQDYEQQIDAVNLVNIELGLQINELREQVAELNSQIHTIEQTQQEQAYGKIENEISNLIEKDKAKTKQIQELQSQLTSTNLEIADIQNQHSQILKLNADLEKQVSSIQNGYAILKTQYTEQISASGQLKQKVNGF